MCNVTLTFKGINTRNLYKIRDLIVNTTNITLSTEQLAKNCHYSVNVTASNIHGKTTTDAIISKLCEKGEELDDNM